MAEHGNNEETPGLNKDYKIVINARQVTTTEHKLTYEQVLGLASIPQGNATALFTVTYERGEHGKAEGTLSDGQNITIKDGMVFNVSTTNKS